MTSQTPDSSAARIRRLDVRDPDFFAQLDALLAFEAQTDEAVGRAVDEILRAVRTTGDAAVLDYTRRFDGLTVTHMAELELPKSALAEAFAALPAEQKDALVRAAERIETFHERQKLEDWADRDFDAHVERTRERPLAAGKISPQEALKVAAVLAGLAFLLVLPLGWRVVAWSVPALVIAATYPFTKRFLPVPQAYLGVAFPSGIPMAWVAIRGETDAACWTLFCRQLLLDHRLRHRIRHGRPPRRPETAGAFFGHHLRALGRAGGVSSVTSRPLPVGARRHPRRAGAPFLVSLVVARASLLTIWSSSARASRRAASRHSCTTTTSGSCSLPASCSICGVLEGRTK